MVLYILLGLIAATVTLVGIRLRRDRYSWMETTSRMGAITLVGLIVSLLICGVGALNQAPESYRLQSTKALRALVTTSTNASNASGSFFLGFGSVSAKTEQVNSVAYIETARDGGSTLKRIDVRKAVIYEGSEIPRVEEWAHVVRNNKTFVPWDYTITLRLSPDVQYRFHIPKGTILTHYEIIQ